tara:strand:- start:58 stop:576 length:519 start_codon:yes stop_codon:yes gene_type:complete
MKSTIIILSLLFVCACDYSVQSANINGNPALTASQYINYSESTHRQELSHYIGVDPVRTEWCAAFVNAVLGESGMVNLFDLNSKTPLMARGFLDWGTPVTVAGPGDLLIFPRGNQGWQGHVGFWMGTIIQDNVAYYQVLGGNQNNKVSIKLYRVSTVISIRRNSWYTFYHSE